MLCLSICIYWDSTVDMDNLEYYAVCIALMLCLSICIYWDRHVLNCFKEVLKDPNVNLIMKQIKLQCLCPVEPKNISGTSKIKTKRGETFGSKC